VCNLDTQPPKRRLADPRTGMGIMTKRKDLAPAGDQTPIIRSIAGRGEAFMLAVITRLTL
jgi:hypothetical protein